MAAKQEIAGTSGRDLLAQLAAQIAAGMLARGVPDVGSGPPREARLASEAVAYAKAIFEESARVSGT